MSQDEERRGYEWPSGLEWLTTYSDDVLQVLSELGVFFRDYVHQTGFSNTMWQQWGYSQADLVNDRWKELIHPDDRERVLQRFEEVRRGRSKRFSEQYRIRTTKGEWRWVFSRGAVVAWTDEGEAACYIGSDVDITSQKLAEERLRSAKQHAEAKVQEAETLRVAGAVITSTLEVQRTIELVLQQALQVVPYDTATVQLLKGGALEVVGGHGWDDIQEVIGLRFPVPGYNPNTQVVLEKRPVIEGDIQQRYPAFRTHGGAHIRSWMGIPLIVRGEVIGLLALDSSKEHFFTDQHLRLAAAFADHVALGLSNAQLYEETRRLAMEDSLTGVSSRRSFFLQAKQILAQTMRYGRKLSVLMFDLDNFKSVNDRFGHSMGDDILRRVAEAASGVFRSADILARYGGEEFAVLLPETDLEGAREIAERLRRVIADTSFPPALPDAAMEIRVSVSVGITELISEHDSSIDHLLSRADRALYRAKRQGRNRVEAIVQSS
jgi:diguanylate cyclase (GGDEF)-like protein/PAS domain S-box-containing protein